MNSEIPKTDLVGEAVLIDETGQGKYQVEVRAGTAKFLVDEPAAAGGLGSGPNPYDLLSAALGSCTLMTIRLYADRKHWPLARVRVRVTHHRSTLLAKDSFVRDVLLEGDLDATQKARLMEIADHCPVHLTLERGSEVTTTLIADEGVFTGQLAIKCEHMKDMDEACSK